MANPTSDDVIEQSVLEAMVYGTSFRRISLNPTSGLLEVIRIPINDVYRFNYLPGRSHSHSRKIWKQRMRRSHRRMSQFSVSYETPR
jgi:hypothetical protein